MELAAAEQAAVRINAELKDNRAILAARSRLEAERAKLAELGRQQRAVEHETDDLNAKLSKIDDDLYSGRIRNPKELTDLKNESDMHKNQRSQLEEKTLQIMEQVDAAAGRVAEADSELNRLEADWQSRQQRLTADLQKLKTEVGELQNKRLPVAAGIDPGTLEMYQQLKKQKGTAVSQVEGGICTGCRLTLPVGEMQAVRSGKLARCGSCGRILFLS